MTQLAPNQLVLRKALNGPRAVHSIAKHPKLYLATDGKGGGSWRIKYRPTAGATQRWVTISNDARHVEFDAVVRKATELLSDLALNGVDPKHDAQRKSGTFEETFLVWIERHAKVRKKSWAADVAMYRRHVQCRLGGDEVEVVDRARIIEVLDDIAKHATPLQANRCQALISAVFSWALDEGRVKAHPALRIRKRGEETVRELVMAPDQLRAFWAELQTLGATSATAIKLLLLLGSRLSEIVGIRKTELHLGAEPQWKISGDRTKNSLGNVLPLPGTAVELLGRALAGSTDAEFVFPARFAAGVPYYDKFISRQCKGIFREVGAGDMRLHDLRHQAATGMAQCGVPLEIRQLVQNQISGRRQSIGARYDQHDYFLEKKRALELWERRLLAVVEGREFVAERY